MSDAEVRISIDMTGSVDLKVEEVWPDGDAPEHITADAIAELMAKDTKRRTLDDWCLIDDLQVTVHVTHLNPDWKPDPPLPGLTRPAPFTESSRAEPWSR